MPSNKAVIAHGVSSAIVGVDDTQTLTAKTLTAPVITNPSVTGGTFTDATIVGGVTTLVDSTSTFVDNSDNTKVLQFELSGITTATTRTWTLPDSSDTFVGKATADAFTGVKTFGAAGNVGKLKVAGTTSGTITLDATAIAGTSVLTLPAATDTLVGRATSDTLTNKTLTAPTLTTPTMSSPTITGTTAKGGAAGAAGSEVELRNVKTTADATDASHYTFTIPNAIHGAAGVLFVSATLGDGDATHAQSYNFAISRIPGANASITLSAAIGSASNTGATGNAVVLPAFASVVGAIGSPQTAELNVRCTRSAGSATSHRIMSRVIMMNANATGVTVVAN